MSCSTVNYGGTPVILCGPVKQIEMTRESEGERWCFKCRKRQEFFFIVTRDEQPSYYGPNPSIQCGHCKTDDGDCFPGTSREWDE